jgi:glutathione peroxidase
MIMLKLIAASMILISCAANSTSQETGLSSAKESIMNNNDTTKNIYGFKVEGLTGGNIDFSSFKGKKILVVNTASECGYTPQYKELQELYEKYKSKLVIVGFPANNFGGQEPGSNSEIKSFCEKNYGVSFPMAAKISVKGDDIAPIYQWLTHKDQNGVMDAEIKWNFNKFLLDENGRLITKFESKTTPMSEEITSKL